ncbi:MAG TPA: hypothetical protein VGQ36_05025, partial [Thermoanaerobaculia bacterium]|nr:hypothetical protein [Thermoanaerobaculia bacterium]
MRILGSALLLGVLLAAVAAHASFEFVPPASTNQTFIFAAVRGEIWRDGCVPANPRVTRTGTAIEVMWSAPRHTACPLALTEWSSNAPIGVLDAGVYDVALKVDDAVLGVTTLRTMKLIVDEAAPALVVEPRVVRASTPGTARISLCSYFGLAVPDPLVVMVGDTGASVKLS